MNLKLVDFLAKINQKPGFFKKPGFLTPEEKQALKNKIELMSPPKTALTPLKEEPFIGMRSERQDLENSSQWVKKLREKEWS